MFKNMGRIFFRIFILIEILRIQKNQSVAALIGARTYRFAGRMAIHSEMKEEYEKNAW